VSDQENRHRANAEAEAQGEAYFERYRDHFAPRVLDPGAPPDVIDFYQAAIAARTSEAEMSRLRAEMLEDARLFGIDPPVEVPPDRALRLVEGLREHAVRADADPREVSFYETLIGADAFRRAFFQPAARDLMAQTDEAERRGRFG
jgi:hypothetical protein